MKNEKRLIDAYALEKAIRTDYFEHFTQYHDTDQIALIDMVCDDIEESPTVDAVPVVRCKNCRKRHTWECAMNYESDDGKEQYGWESDTDFCSWGERKDGDWNG